MARRGKLAELPQEEQQRPIRLKRYEYLFLIVCEDQKTEKEYFEGFRAHFPERTVYLRTIGAGLDPKGVVERAIQERNKLHSEAERDVDTTWAVFDKDDADLQPAKRERFEEAFRVAEGQSIKLAFSNEVFELWLLLFLTDVSAGKPLPRKVIYDSLQEQVRQRDGLGEFEYNHGNRKILAIINLIGSEEDALRRAAALLAAHAGKSPIDMNPSTRVHLLVNEIREWIRYYNYDPKLGR
jgi:hypothetical protein